MYAIIRTGGKQTKVREGDVIDVERLRADGKVEFTPLLVVDSKGKVFSKRDQLKNAKVEANVVGDSSGDKIDIFKYKNKSGYRRRQGHRQRYTAIEITKIKPPTTRKPAAKKDDAAEDAEKAPAKKPAAAKKEPAKSSTAKTSASKKTTTKKSTSTSTSKSKES
jgi:large subunit ribosomal protein L21